MNTFRTIRILLSATMMVMAACTPSVPDQAVAVSDAPDIYPDYAGVTVPANIAPLNFVVNNPGDAYVVHLHPKGDKGIVLDGPKVDIPVDRWHRLLQTCRDDTVMVDIYVRDHQGWRRHPVIKVAVAEPVDPYISYRLIEPSYIGFEDMRICQRSLESFDEEQIFNNRTADADDDGQCINCHSYQDYNRGGNMQMHVRVNNGGTVIVHDGAIRKVDLKVPGAVSGGVYPSWHPSLPLIAYSNNTTTQNFHERHNNKVEVQDSRSDIVLYDVEANTVRFVANDSTALETFPYWNHDGTALYYCSAGVPALSDDDMRVYKARGYREFRYDILRRPFDPATRTFGDVDTVYNASELGVSATFPRESPDGRFLLFTQAPYGTFHIWHRDADLMLMDMTTGQVRPLDEVNSPDVESYHSFSSDGRWIVFSSRRDDGSYTRLYLAHFGPDGRATKPFLLPQRDPESNVRLFKSYNIPEFMARPVSVSRQQLVDAVKAPSIPARTQ